MLDLARPRWRLLCLLWTALGAAMALPPAGQAAPHDNDTATPIKHVIVIYGENRSFDHLFATYQPEKGQTVRNLLSEGIIDASGHPGPNFARAIQYRAKDAEGYSIAPAKAGVYAVLPPPLTGSAHTAPSDTDPPPFATKAAASAADHSLPPQDIAMLTTGATGLPRRSIDTRIADVNKLPPGPFQITPGVPYDSYAASPVHRFYQNWQQSDCSADHATAENPSGCLHDLFAWVEVATGAGGNGAIQPKDFTDQSTGEGAAALGFYNVQQGDAPYFARLAREYTLADNYHQPAMGGTGLNSIIAGFGDALWYTGAEGVATKPPAAQIENPDPQHGTNNWYTQDGYRGGSYSACADASQPGVGAVVHYLQSLPRKIDPHCQPGHYYLLNNYAPGYLGNGKVNTGTFVVPPVTTPSIGDMLHAAGVSVTWFAQGWDRYRANPRDPHNTYCAICNPFNYETSIMTRPALRDSMIQDMRNFQADLKRGVLPAVSLVKPGALDDGHPASSKVDLFEAFTRRVITALQADPKLWASTAVFITTDESGGYYDSGYIQPLDFFGDGPRIPMIVVSPYSSGGRVVHSYTDHVSILKFIEANWRVGPISARSRDNLPNPKTTADNPYVPTNSPAIGDMMDMFDFTAKPETAGTGDAEPKPDTK